MERYQLIHRDKVPNDSMRDYRVTMAPYWFPNNPKAQADYIGLPDNPSFGNATDNRCLMDGDKVVGTISLYDFVNVRNKQNLTNNGLLEDIPQWLKSFVYQGDISTIPESQRQGLSNLMINKTIGLACKTDCQRRIFGITKNTNLPMKKSIEKSGGEFIDRSACLFIKFSDTHRPRAKTKLKGEIVKMHFDEKFPPIVQMFYSKKGDLVAATIATSPNAPNSSDAKPTGDINELYSNQCVGIINPGLSRNQVNELAIDIYASAGRFKYVSLYQMSEQTNDYRSRSPINNGFKQGWVVYEFNSH